MAVPVAVAAATAVAAAVAVVVGVAAVPPPASTCTFPYVQFRVPPLLTFEISLMLTALALQEGGVVGNVRIHLMDGDEPSLYVATATTICGSRFLGKIQSDSPVGSMVHGTGTGLSWQEALVPALAETIERQATATFYRDQFIVSTAKSLDHRALDLDTIPTCSETERASQYCSLNLPSKNEPIRWVKGLSLHDGEPIWVPVVMVYSHAGWRSPQERFWLPISTGCAAHRSYEEATLGGLCEVVERDAISLIWLQQLELPKILVDGIGPVAAPYWDLYQRGSADVEYHFFDATTDVCLPTVYGVQVSQHHPYARTIVACATALSFDEAIAKVIKDFVAFKRVFVSSRAVPREVAAFTGLLDGATYMARPEHAEAFDFLLRSRKHVSLRELSAEQRPLTTLSEIVRHLASHKMQALAVDLTTDEALRAGLYVVRVLVPELQPLSLHAAAQYRAHPRLYSAPVRMGYVAKDEAHLNQWPQPFA